MFGILGKIFGSSDTTNKIIDSADSLLDEAFYTDQEEAEDNAKNKQQVFENKIALLNAQANAKSQYHPYKLTQRLIALSAWFTFLFVIQVGLYTILFGDGDTETIKLAIEFMNQLWVGEIIFAIISFYFGYDMKKKFDEHKSSKVKEEVGK